MSLLMAATVMADEWTLVSDVSVLQAGDQLIIACNTQGATAGAYSASVSGLSVIQSTFTAQKETITSVGAGTVVFTLGGQAGEWTFVNASGKVLGTTGTRKLLLDGSGTTTWTIAFSDGNAVIASTNTACGTIQYNASASPRFWCHTSQQTPVQLYRLGPAAPKVHLNYQGFPYKRTSCEVPSYSAGATVKLAVCPLENEAGEVVIGWKYDGQTYEPGSNFTMPAEDVELVAVWGEKQQGVERVNSTEHRARKILRDGQLIILRDGKEYNIMGGRVK